MSTLIVIKFFRDFDILRPAICKCPVVTQLDRSFKFHKGDKKCYQHGQNSFPTEGLPSEPRTVQFHYSGAETSNLFLLHAHPTICQTRIWRKLWIRIFSSKNEAKSWVSAYEHIAEHSICHPGLPVHQGDAQEGSPALEAFHSAKSRTSFLSSTISPFSIQHVGKEDIHCMHETG